MDLLWDGVLRASIDCIALSRFWPSILMALVLLLTASTRGFIADSASSFQSVRFIVVELDADDAGDDGGDLDGERDGRLCAVSILRLFSGGSVTTSSSVPGLVTVDATDPVLALVVGTVPSPVCSRLPPRSSNCGRMFSVGTV